MQVSAPKSKLPLKQARSARLRPPPFRARRRQLPSWRVVGAVAAPLVVLGVVAYVARRRFFQGVAILASAVEEVADTVEDAAEDVRDYARARAEGGEAG